MSAARPCLWSGSSLLYGQCFVYAPKQALAACHLCESPCQHPAEPFLKRFISPGGSFVVLMGSDACPLEGMVPSPLWELFPVLISL